MCLDCYEEYNKDNIKISEDSYESPCPKANCYGSVVEIDDLILPVIKLLNQKGYITTYCCSSHSYDAFSNPNTYISFYRDCFPESLPKGFYAEDDKWYEEFYPKYSNKDKEDICIRKYYDDKLNEFELHKEICKTMIELMKWVEKLEKIE